MNLSRQILEKLRAKSHLEKQPLTMVMLWSLQAANLLSSLLGLGIIFQGSWKLCLEAPDRKSQAHSPLAESAPGKDNVAALSEDQPRKGSTGEMERKTSVLLQNELREGKLPAILSGQIILLGPGLYFIF